MTRKSVWLFTALLLSCAETEPNVAGQQGQGQGQGTAVAPADKSQEALGAKKPDIAPVKAESAPAASPRLADAKEALAAQTKISDYFSGHIGRRVYIQIDKPIYKPGETIWFKVWDLKARSLDGDHASQGMIAELVSPKGSVAAKFRLREEKGTASNAFDVQPGMQGGEYTLRVTTFDGQKGERPVIISTYEPPRIKFKLEFIRKAYGVGDEVQATIEVKRPTGEVLKSQELTGMIRLDGADLPSVKLRTDDKGAGIVKFTLPAQIQTGDGLLTVLAEDGGLTESISKRIPIIVNKLQFSSYPEGGQMIEGVPGRIYFEAKNPLGKPADIAGKVVDDQQQTMARFESYKEGLGRFEFTPATGRTYHVEIDKPVGVTEHYSLPVAAPAGCNLRSYDDLDGELKALRVAVRCSEAKRVMVVGMLRENLLDSAMVDVKVGQPTIVYLEPKTPEKAALAEAQGVARVTVFDDKNNPLAERLVYRNRRNRLQVKVEAHKKAYTPREQVTLAVSTTSKSGAAVPAELAIAVVDDTVISYADDKNGHMLSRLYLEPEISGKVEEPNLFFDLTEQKSALATDLLMGTRGWRKFEWQPVFAPPPPVVADTGGLGMTGTGVGGGGFGGLRKGGGMGEGQGFGRGNLRPADGAAAPGAAPKPAPVAAAAPPAPPAKMPAPAAPVVAAAPKEAKADPAANKDQANNRVVAPRAQDAKPAAGPRAAAPPAMGARPMGGLAKAEAAPEPEMAERPRGDEGRMEKKKVARDRDLDDALGGVGGLGIGGEIGDRPARRPMQQPVAWAAVRVFPAPTYGGDYNGARTDFRETIFWQPQVKTGKDGKATVTFYLSDGVTSFRVFSEGTGGGVAGRDETVLKSSLPFSMAVKVPTEVSAGDKLKLPLVLTNERGAAIDVQLQASFGDLLTLDRAVERTTGTMQAGARDALFYPLTVTGKSGKSKISFVANASGLKDEFEREVNVVPLGFPQEFAKSGQLKGTTSVEIDLGEMLANTGDGSIKLFPSPVATMISGLDGMLRQPSGCFEQTSSSNYPNVMILRYLKQNNIQDPKILERANRYIDDGYKKLVGFETKEKGYEWFGGTPAHEALSAYGLVEFLDMREIYPDVDRDMIDRTTKYLRARRDGKGGYLRDAKALDSFGRAAPEVTNAYITWSLSEAKQKDIDTEINESAKQVSASSDAYLLALYTNTLVNAGRKGDAVTAAKKLASLQEQDGVWKKASHSITRSGGQNLEIETTSLAIMALLKVGGYDDNVRRGVEWLYNHRGGYGQWGSTQATVLALKAMTMYAQASAKTKSGGAVTVRINGKNVSTIQFEAGRREPLQFDSLGQYLTAGKNTIELVSTSADAMPFTMGISYRTVKPATSPQATVDITTALEKPAVKMGETTRLNVTITNKTQEGKPMTLARVGIPGGLQFQNWQLKELREKGLIAFYETQAREVFLYFRELKPGETIKVPIDLVAAVPGEFTAPASTAYLYYTDEHKTWVDGTKVTIEP